MDAKSVKATTVKAKTVNAKTVNAKSVNAETAGLCPDRRHFTKRTPRRPERAMVRAKIVRG